MRTRQEIKAIAKQQFKSNYWNCVLAALLVTAVMGALSWLSGGQEAMEMTQMTPDQLGQMETGNGSIKSSGGSLLSRLLSGPLTVGLAAFYVRNLYGERDSLSVTTPFTEAFRNYPRKLGGTLWMGLFVFLWSLLLVIPGIIKSLSYGMTKYILADCPNVKAKDALKLSMRMMNGHKWEYFVLGLSFLGWLLLSVLTLGLLLTFYVNPYMENTFAAYYLEVRDDALRRGVVTPEQLDGTQSV